MTRPPLADDDDWLPPRQRALSAAILASFALPGAPGMALQIRPDATCILFGSDSEATMPVPNRPPQYFGPISALDERTRLIDLSTFFAAGDAQAGRPSVAVLPIAGDLDPLVIVGGVASWDTGPRAVFVGPYGTPFLSPGPRILFTVAGGTKGNVYTIEVTWQDTAGQNIMMPVYQPVQWDGTG